MTTNNTELAALAASYQRDYIKADADRRILQHRLDAAEARIAELEKTEEVDESVSEEPHPSDD